jgi:hypothetical protein
MNDEPSKTMMDVEATDPEGTGPDISVTDPKDIHCEVEESTSIATIFSRIIPSRYVGGVLHPPLRDVCQLFEMVGMSRQTAKIATLMDLCVWSKTPLVVRDGEGTTGPELLNYLLPIAPEGTTIEELSGGKGKRGSSLRLGTVYVVFDPTDPLWTDPEFLHVDLLTDIDCLKQRLIEKTQNKPFYVKDLLIVRQALVKKRFETVITVPVNIGFGKEFVNGLDVGLHKFKKKSDALIGLLKYITISNSGLRQGPVEQVACYLGIQPGQLRKFLGMSTPLSQDPEPLECGLVDYFIFLKLTNGVLVNPKKILTSRQLAVFDVVKDEIHKNLQEAHPTLPWPPPEKTLLNLLAQNFRLGADRITIDDRLKRVEKHYPSSTSTIYNELQLLVAMGFLTGKKVGDTVYYAITSLFPDRHLRIPQIPDIGASAFGITETDPVPVEDIFSGEVEYVSDKTWVLSF